jgi:hypothetical protein
MTPTRFSFLILSLIVSMSTGYPLHDRRTMIKRSIVGSGGFLLSQSAAVVAFENAVPEAAQYADRPKRRGPAPTDLGLKKRQLNQYGDMSDDAQLKVCKAAPNCFSTSGDAEFDAASLIEPWVPPTSLVSEGGVSAVSQVLSDVLRTYTPGQGGIDGGGFKIVAANNPQGYYQVILFFRLLLSLSFSFFTFSTFSVVR